MIIFYYNLKKLNKILFFPVLILFSFNKLSKHMFNQLPTASATVKIPRHILNSLTEDELLIATNKGWTVNA